MPSYRHHRLSGERTDDVVELAVSSALQLAILAVHVPIVSISPRLLPQC